MDAAADDRHARVYALAAVLLWSTVATAFKLSLRHLDVAQLLFYSNVVACLCLCVIVLVQGNGSHVLRAGSRDWMRALTLGLLNPLAYYLVLFAAYDRLPAQVAQALNYTWAITLMLLSVPLLRHRVTRRDVFATVVCYGGVLAVLLGGAGDSYRGLDAAGVGLALGSTLIWSYYWICKARERQDPVVSLCMGFLCALPFTALVCVLFSGLQPVTLPGLAGAAWVGVCEMGVTFVLWLSALRRTTSAARITTLIFLSPFLSLVFIHNVAREDVMTGTVVGLACIAAGLLIQQRRGWGRLASRQSQEQS